MIATAKRVTRLGVGVLIGLSSNVWDPRDFFRALSRIRPDDRDRRAATWIGPQFEKYVDPEVAPSGSRVSCL
jgi:hypothetical protein